MALRVTRLRKTVAKMKESASTKKKTGKAASFLTKRNLSKNPFGAKKK